MTFRRGGARRAKVVGLLSRCYPERAVRLGSLSEVIEKIGGPDTTRTCDPFAFGVQQIAERG
jgi:hypothetical protein